MKMSGMISKDRISAIAIFIIAVLIFISAMGIQDSDLSTIQKGPKAGDFPIFISMLLAVLSIILFCAAGFRGRSLEKAPEEASKAYQESSKIEEPFKIQIRKTAAFIILMCAYFVILPYSGFMIATILYGTVFLALFFREKVAISFLKALLISACCYLIFKVGLHIPLPGFLQAIQR